MQSEGVYNSNISNEVTNFRVVESRLKKENRTFASTQTLGKFDQKCCANFIHSHPRLFHSSATPSLTLSPRSKHSSSVNVEFSSILSILLRSNSLASLSLITDFISSLNSDFVFSSSSIPGILITNSPISITCNYIDHAYIKHFLSKNPFTSQKPLRKIRFAERTCAKKGKLLTLTSCEDASQTCILHPVSSIQYPANAYGFNFQIPTANAKSKFQCQFWLWLWCCSAK